MFSKDQRPKSDPSPAPQSFTGPSPSASATPSIISADLYITGNLRSDGDIQIDGRIDGDVISRSVTVGESAEVKGTVTCDRIRVCGQLTGEIRSNTVIIAKSARVSGDIANKSLEIEAGAVLEGGIRRLEGDALAGVGAESKSADGKAPRVTKLSDAASGSGSARAAG